MSVGALPECAAVLFDARRTVLCLTGRAHQDWVDDLLAFTRSENSAERIGLDPSVMFDSVTADQARESLLPVSRRGAEDLLKLLAVGSFYSGPDRSLQESDEARDGCVHDVLASVGDDAEFFTNHGHAEDEEAADFLTSSFHWNSLAVTLYDVCLIAVTSELLLIAWRFEDA